MIPEAVLIFGLAAATAIGSMASARRQQTRVDEVWRAVGAQVGLGFTTTSAKIFRPRSRYLDGTLDRASVRADTYLVSGGETATVYTRVVAACPEVPRCFDLHVRKRGMLQQLGKLLGASSVETGDAAFDERFVVKAADPALAQATLGPALRERLLHHQETDFLFAGGALTATITGHVTDAARLRDTLRLTAAFAAAPAARLAQWTDLARQLGGAMASDHVSWIERGQLPAITLEAHGVELTLRDDAAGGRLILGHGQGSEPPLTIPRPAAGPLDDPALAAAVQQAVETATAAALGLRPYRG